MAECKPAPEEFIKNAFTPHIGVWGTTEVQKACEKNNLKFAEILQPFSRLLTEVVYKDPTGQPIVLKNLKFTFVDVDYRPQDVHMSRMLRAAINKAPEATMMVHQVKHYKLNLPVATPWYENWRDAFLGIQEISGHEFTQYFLACWIVVSSKDSDPIDAMVKLENGVDNIQSSNSDSKSRWFCPNVLKYYIVLHDVLDGNYNEGVRTYDFAKNAYGQYNSYFLKINSRPAGMELLEHLADPWSQFLKNKPPVCNTETDGVPLDVVQDVIEPLKPLQLHPLSPELEASGSALTADLEDLLKMEAKCGHGNCLSVDDVDQIKSMIYEFAKCCLLPFVEEHLVYLNDMVANRKGVSKSLLSATKRWFTANKPTATSSAVNNKIYPSTSNEVQIRKLGDLHFMFGNYSAAFQAYHTAKREYRAEEAWLYYAGALEMAALSAFLCNEASKKTFDYMDESISTYLYTCKKVHFATRATVLSSECLKSRQMYGEMAEQLIKMTSEDHHARSALLLEQASYCFIHTNMLRKYAFHMVLAGHRFSKAGNKYHSLRCYKQAYQIYEDAGWDLASDHIHYVMGQLGSYLENFAEAVEPLAKLLRGGDKQTVSQQVLFLKEFLAIMEQKLNKSGRNEIPTLPVPDVPNSLIKVLVGPTPPLSAPGKIPALGINFDSNNDPAVEKRWNKLEEMLVEQTSTTPMIFKPMITLYNAPLLETNTVIAIVNEPIQVNLQLSNPLQTALVLTDIYLLWTYTDEAGDSLINATITEDVDKIIKTNITKSVILQGNCSQDLILRLTPLVTGDVTITAVCYTITAAAPTGDQQNRVKGKKLINLSNDDSVKPIQIRVVPNAPCLQMTFSTLNLNFLAGEVQKVSIDLQNTGTVPLRHVHIATSVPQLISTCELTDRRTSYTINDGDSTQLRDKLAKKNHVITVPLPDGQLHIGQSTSFCLWIRGPNAKGPCPIDLLTYYENVDSKSVPRYRLIRHTWNLTVQESMKLDLTAQKSHTSHGSEDIILSLKPTNLNEFHHTISTELSVTSVALLSRNWTLTECMRMPKVIILSWQESANIQLKVRRELFENTKYSKLNIIQPDPDISNIEKVIADFATKLHTPLLNVFQPIEDSGNKDGTLIVYWKALVCDAEKMKIVYGQTSSPVEMYTIDETPLDQLASGLILNSSRSMVNNDLIVPTRQVTYNLLYPSIIQHDFSRDPILNQSINVVLHNTINQEVEVTVSTLKLSPKCYQPMLPDNRAKLGRQPWMNVVWVSNGKLIRTLKPLQTISVNLSVILISPGSYDLLSTLGVYCSNNGDASILQDYDANSCLVVIDGNNQ